MSRSNQGRARGALASRRLRLESLESRQLLAGDVYLVNFELAGSGTPNRFLSDWGDTYALRANGATYGWSTDHTDQSRDRGVNLDQRLDSLIHIEAGAKWEFQLPNGRYQVTTSIGDASNPSTHTLRVEGLTAFNAVPLAANEFRQTTTTVDVTDGRLTLDSGAAPDKATRMNYVYIVGVPSAANGVPAAPTIMEPSFVGQVVNPSDVHMEAIGFVDPDGNAHQNTDWEIWTADANGQPIELAWTTIGISGVERVHTHLGDGIFVGAHAGQADLNYSTNYVMRVRFRDSVGSVSPWATRTFSTGAISQAFPLEIDDVAATPAPKWLNSGGTAVVLPGPAGAKPRLQLESPQGGVLLTIAGANGAVNAVTNPPALAAHVYPRIAVFGGASGLNLPESDLTFVDGSGSERTAYLPALNVPANATVYYWIAADGATYYGAPGQTTPDFSNLARSSVLGFATLEPGYRVEVVASGLELPVNIAFVPNPGPDPNDPKFYVTELYGNVKVVYNDGSVHNYATGLLNYNPTGAFPGSGEQGVAGIVVDPATGDVIITRATDSDGVEGGDHHPQVVRLHSVDEGRTSSGATVILDMVGETQGQSHQISDVSIGPDGKLYVHNGDGFDASTALNLNSLRGKILRINLDGSVPTDNPFYNAADGITDRDYIYAYGFRNPFGGAWRAADGKLYEVENGPGSNDRFAQVNPGVNYGWNGTAGSMTGHAIYIWNVPHAPVDVAFVQPQTFGGSGFPASNQDVAFVTESGPTWATGPQSQGKRIVKFKLDQNGALVEGPTTFVEYVGQGKATIGGIVAGPDGLYFTDIYPDLNFQNPTAAGARVLRVVYVGTGAPPVSFSGENLVGASPLTVQFNDDSAAVGVTSWLWNFGDGATSNQQNPTHIYSAPGVYDVTLTTTGSNGVQSISRQDYVVAGYRPEDTNQDGVVNQAVDVANLIAGWNRDTSALSTLAKLQAGDNNLDGIVDLDDAYRLLNALKGLAAQPVAVAGDFDGNARVDGNDFLVWQRSGGSQSELEAWMQNFAADQAFATAQAILAPTNEPAPAIAAVASQEAVEEAFAGDPDDAAYPASRAFAVDDRFMWLAAAAPSRVEAAAAGVAMLRDRRQADGMAPAREFLLRVAAETPCLQAKDHVFDSFPEASKSRRSLANAPTLRPQLERSLPDSHHADDGAFT